MPEVLRVPLGASGTRVSRIGFGAMPLSGVYGAVDDDVSIELVRHVVASGVNFFDTSNSYGDGHNETLLGRALTGLRDGVVLATKFGMQGPGLGNRDAVRAALDESLERLQTDRIDVYYLHRVDPETPVEVTVEAMGELVREGMIGAIGLSEVGAHTLRRAHAVFPVSAVQQEYSLFTREVERELLPTMRELGVALVAYSPFGRGMLTGSFRSAHDLPREDLRRARYPRFEGEHLKANLEAANALFTLAERQQTSPAALALQWVLAQGLDVIPIPGTRRRDNFDANVAAAIRPLDRDAAAALSAAFPVGRASGDRYSPGMMAKLDT